MVRLIEWDQHGPGHCGAGFGTQHVAVGLTCGQSGPHGVAVVRSTRCRWGIVLRNSEVDDDAFGFVASGELTPAKSRVLLQLALTKTTDPARIQQMFYEY